MESRLTSMMVSLHGGVGDWAKCALEDCPDLCQIWAAVKEGRRSWGKTRSATGEASDLRVLNSKGGMEACAEAARTNQSAYCLKERSIARCNGAWLIITALEYRWEL